MSPRCILLAATAITIVAARADAGPRHARPDELNGKNHALWFQPRFDLPVAGVIERVVVGGTVSVKLLPNVGSVGHTTGPEVYRLQSPNVPVVRAPAGVAIKAIDYGFDVTCRRAGRFEIRVEVNASTPAAVSDSIDIECVTPTRFAIGDAATTRLVAAGSRTSVSVNWYGRVGSHEFVLRGSAPVTLDGLSRSVELGPVFDGYDDTVVELVAVRPGARAVLRSGRLTATLPIEIVESGHWTLSAELAPFRGAPPTSGRPHIKAIARDRAGHAVTVWPCTLTMFRAGMEIARRDACDATVITNRYYQTASPERRQNLLPRVTDRVCIAALGQTACISLAKSAGPVTPAG